MIQVSCLFCEKKFETRKSYRARGHGKFCTISCSSKHHHKLNEKKPNVTCSYCGDAFYKNASKCSGSKSGLFFCSREHKDLAQRFDSQVTDFSGRNVDGSYSYRERALRSSGAKCNRCGWDKHIAGITVHHVDHDRSNNALTNLEVLCACCHAIEHWA